MLKGFKEFILRGNVVDLAVAVVIGMAFSEIVTALSRDVIGGLIGAIGGSELFAAESVTIRGTEVVYGTTITAIIEFLIVAAVVYFAIVVPMRRILALRDAGADAPTPAPSDEARLLTEIRDLLREQRAAG